MQKHASVFFLSYIKYQIFKGGYIYDKMYNKNYYIAEGRCARRCNSMA